MTPSEHVAILASAGTGKTTRLADRYVTLLARGVPQERILATTFTRKAAGQILDRVLATLVRAATSQGACDEAAARTGLRGWRSEDARAVLLALVRGVNRAAIGTIDALFARLAGVFEFTVDLPPGWRVGNEEEEAELRRESVVRVLEGKPREQAVELLRLIASRPYSSSVVGALVVEVEACHAAYLEAPREAWRALGPPPEAHALAADELAPAIERLAGARLPTRNGELMSAWRNAHSSSLEAARRGAWEVFLARGLAKNIAAGQLTYSRRDIPSTLAEAYAPLVSHARAIVLGKFYASGWALHDVLDDYDARCGELRRRTGLLAFDDIPRALLNAQALGRLDELHFRVDATIDHVLFDEFQDTSITQFRVLEPLIEEILAGGGGAERGDAASLAGRSLFCVGDVKQSLYQWRQAEPGLLPAIPARWPQVRPEQLAESYRSSQVVLDAVNDVFGPLGSNPALRDDDLERAAQAWSAEFERQHAKRDLAGWVALREVDVGEPTRTGAARASAHAHGDDEGDGADPRGVLRAGVERAAEWSRLACQATIALLVWRRKHIPFLVHELRGRGVRASEEGGNPLTDSAAVSAALSALRAGDHPGNTAARFHAGTSPLGPTVGFADWESDVACRRAASAIRAQIAGEGLGPVLARWHAAIAGACDARDAARFEQLVELGEAYEPRSGRLSEFVEHVERTRVEAPEPARVRVMTVHASKGLEFDAVILADLDSRVLAPTPRVVMDRGGPLEPVRGVCRYPNEAIRALDPRLDRLVNDWRARELKESLCGLYVAMTRARHALEMFVAAPVSNGLTLARVLRGALGAEGTPAADRVLWARGDPRWHESVEREHAALAPLREPLRVALAPRHGRSERGASRVSPSMLGDAGVVDPARVLAPDRRAADLGTLLHAWLARIEWLWHAEPDTHELVRVAAGLGWRENADLRHALRLYAEAIRQPAIAGALTRPALTPGEHAVVHREFEFAGLDGEPGAAGRRVVQGRMDRVVIRTIADRAHTAEVIDFKTDAASGDEPAEPAARHAPQLRAYRRAVARLTGLDESRVACRVVLLLRGKVVDVE